MNIFSILPLLYSQINWGGGKCLAYRDVSGRSPLLLDCTFNFLDFLVRFLRLLFDYSLFFSFWFDKFSVQSILFSRVNRKILLFFYILLTGTFSISMFMIRHFLYYLKASKQLFPQDEL